MIKQLIHSDFKQSLLVNNNNKNLLLNLNKVIMYLMNLGLTFFLMKRWLVSGHFPLSNLYESLIFLSWGFTIIYIITSFTLRGEALIILLPTISWSITPITLLTCAYATFCVPQELQKADVLVPALQSNWLIMHVSVMILSYASLLIGSLFAFSIIIKEKLSISKPHLLNAVTEYLSFNNKIFLDNLSYRFIGLGFALLTLGIISGAVWANSAWGSYWSWDPKETWAFVTWLIYAIYLHLRITKGWYGKQSAYVASFGFFVVWFCYLGVNLFGKGLHSYAFV